MSSTVTMMKRPNSEEALCYDTLPKQPLKKLEFALKRISKVVSLHLEFLQRHNTNIEKFKHIEDWTKLHAEQINASRTVQQLKADMYELEIIGQQVLEEDLPKFEAQADIIKNDILREIAAFVGEHEETIQPCTALRSLSLSQPDDLTESSGPLHSSTPPLNLFPMSPETEELFTNSEPTPDRQLQVQEERRPSTTTYRSWNSLHKELLDLNSLITGFAKSIRSQRENIDRIESNVDITHENVTEGTQHLKTATKYKLALLPLSGAVIGGIVGGPIGLVAGYKAAGLALAVGGGIIGFTGGKFLQKKQYAALQNNNNSLELEDLGKSKLKNSLSLSDLKT